MNARGTEEGLADPYVYQDFAGSPYVLGWNAMAGQEKKRVYDAPKMVTHGTVQELTGQMHHVCKVTGEMGAGCGHGSGGDGGGPEGPFGS